MAFNIGNFISNINQKGETARADKFDVVFALPNTFGDSSISRSLTLMCEVAEFPGLDITTIDYRHHAFIRRIPHHLNYSPLTLNFYCSGAMWEKQLFDVWMDICLPKFSGLINYREDNSGVPLYEATVTINQYDQAGNRSYFAQAQEAFPVSMSPLPTSWSDDSTHRLSVTFAYNKWLTERDGAVGQSTPTQIATPPIISNFTNELRSLIQGVYSISNAKDAQQKLQSIRQLGIAGGQVLGTGLPGTVSSQLPGVIGLVR